MNYIDPHKLCRRVISKTPCRAWVKENRRFPDPFNIFHFFLGFRAIRDELVTLIRAGMDRPKVKAMP
jgi:hypothetical protein